MAQCNNDQVQTTALLDLFLNSVVSDNIIAYLPVQSLVRLSRTNHAFQDFVFETPKVFKYLDLSHSRVASVSSEEPKLDVGGVSWRAERMDENLTEDEFYAGPLRGIFSILRRKKVLQDVQVLILDGLASVTNDLVHEIATSNDFNVRILSIRGCVNVNIARLQRLLKYLCRLDRPAGNPRLQGLYYFTKNVKPSRSSDVVSSNQGVMVTDGATLGVLPVDKSRANTNHDPWYAPTGIMTHHGHRQRSTWEETLMACRGIIAFDAVLCTHMHDAMATCLHDASRDYLSANKPAIPTIATVALGPEGCSGCGLAPLGAPVWGENDIYDFPLLWPPPQSAKVIDAVRPPLERQQESPSHSNRSVYKSQRLIVSCRWCLENRHCDSCHRWWCGDCYNPKRSKKLADLEALSNAGLTNYLPSRDELRTVSDIGGTGNSMPGDSVKVFNGLCVEDCLVGEMMSGAGSFGMWA